MSQVLTHHRFSVADYEQMAEFGILTEDDRNIKRPLYAENGVTEFWIVNLEDGSLEIHRLPQSDGTYRDVQTLRPGQQADIAALPGMVFAVADML